mgnify:CR=1 FL=1|jgi:hypothetical protein
MSKTYRIEIVRDAPTSVISEDVEIALDKAGYEFNQYDGMWSLYDQEADFVGGLRGFLVLAPVELDTAKVKTELEKLDGAQTCEVTIELDKYGI